MGAPASPFSWGTPVIQGNLIGPLIGQAGGNGSSGIKITGGSVTIGGTEAGMGNVISCHNNEGFPGGGPFGPDVGVGIYIAGGAGTVVQGNLIGTNAQGVADTDFPNIVGILIDGAANNTIGGASPTARNVISGNVAGVSIGGSGAINNVVQGNL